MTAGIVTAIPVRAQHADHAAGDSAVRGGARQVVAPLSLPASRHGSGTAWLPDATPMWGMHAMVAGWALMLHGNGFLQYTHQFGTRARGDVGSINWVMLTARHRVAGGAVELRTMLSAEPFTLRRVGYPLLLQTAQPTRGGGNVTDRQHPHELVSELAVTYERALTRKLAVQLYAAAAGEPALGPVSYVHRPSAANDPVAPLGHHMQDMAHTSAGVVTVGAYTRRAKLEGSLFNGAHRDEVPTNLELGGARLRSYSGRLAVNPSDRWSASASYAFVAASPGDGASAHAHGSLHRATAAVHYARPLPGCRAWSSALVFGRNRPSGTARPTASALVESNLDVARAHSVFGRAEYVQRTSAELLLTGAIPPRVGLAALSMGYLHELRRATPLALGLGARGTVNLVPIELQRFYGSRTPLGLVVFGRVRAGGGCAT